MKTATAAALTALALVASTTPAHAPSGTSEPVRLPALHIPGQTTTGQGAPGAVYNLATPSSAPVTSAHAEEGVAQGEARLSGETKSAADKTRHGLTIPSVGLSMPLVPSGVSGGEMQLPASHAAGVLTSSSPTTAGAGTTTIAGHVNWTDGTYAPMSALYHTAPGDTVITDGVEWRVTRTYGVGQDELSDIVSLTDTAGTRKLILVTCKATENGYTDNLVVEAEPA